MGQNVPLYLRVPTDMPASPYKVTAMKRVCCISLQPRRQQSQRSELCHSENHSCFPVSETSPVFLSPWIYYKALVTLLNLFFRKIIFSDFPILTEWMFITIRYVCSLTAGLNVTFVTLRAFVPGVFFPVVMVPVPTPFSLTSLPRSGPGAVPAICGATCCTGWMNEWMNERTSWCFTLPCPHWRGPQE